MVVAMDDSSSDGRKTEPPTTAVDGSKTCDACGASFTQKKNLLRHRRMKHGLDIVCREAESKEFGCSVCPAAFGLRKNLLRHVRAKHEPPADTGPAFQCHSCGFKSGTKDKVKDHIVRNHVPDSVKTNELSRCPLCGLRDFRRALVKHFERDHDVDVSTVSLEFESESEFVDWKAQIERQNANEYSKMYQYTAVDGGKLELYRCHRDGFYRGRGRNVRRRTNSNKIDGHCPSSMRLRAHPSGRVEVVFCGTHVGHLGEEGRLRAIKRARRRQRAEIRLAGKRQPLERPAKLSLADLDADVAHEIVVRDVDLDELRYAIDDSTIMAPDMEFVDMDAERRRLVDLFDQIVAQVETSGDVAVVEDSINSLVAALQDRQSSQFHKQLSLSTESGN